MEPVRSEQYPCGGRPEESPPACIECGGPTVRKKRRTISPLGAVIGVSVCSCGLITLGSWYFENADPTWPILLLAFGAFLLVEMSYKIDVLECKSCGKIRKLEEKKR